MTAHGKRRRCGTKTVQSHIGERSVGCGKRIQESCGSMEKKNILILLTDQWRAECFGFKGHPHVKTPNLDWLAARSDRFENSHTITPLCSPARGCLLTSLLPHQNGVCDNMRVGASVQQPLPDDNDTWLKAASRNGWKTGYFGKWHLGEWNPEQYGVATDVFQHELAERKEAFALANERGELKEDAIARKTAAWKKDERIDEGKLPYYGIRTNPEQAPDYIACQNAIEFVKQNAETPWCLTLSLRSPHFPLCVPEPFYSMYDPENIELPESFHDHFANKPWFQNRHWWPSMNTDSLTEEDWKKTTAAYYGMISYADDLCGKMLRAAMDNSGGRETLVLFTADHGEMMGCHSRFDKGAYFYEEVMRTPLLICENLGKDAGFRSRDEYCSSQDIAATLFDAVQAQAPSGRSLLALLNGSSRASWPQEAFGAYHRYNGHSFEVRCISTPRYKYSYVPQDIDELYDLEKDPHEMVNVSDDLEYAQIKRDLKRRLFGWMRREGDYLPYVRQYLAPAGALPGAQQEQAGYDVDERRERYNER